MTSEIPAGYVTGTWTVDPAHTDIGFSVRHLMVSKVKVSFSSFSGTIVTAADPSASTAELTVDLGSIDTRNDDRDAHLRSGDFFDADNHPTMSYRSSAVRANGDGFAVDGELTIKDVTRPVTLQVEFNGVGPDPWGGTRLGSLPEARSADPTLGSRSTCRSRAAVSWSVTRFNCCSKSKQP